MPDDLARPADTLTMSLFHAALRRDLERAVILLENPGALSPRRSRRLGRHLLWLTGNLRWHHEGEDHYLWPLLLERDPDGSAVLDAMKAEHDAIDEPLLRLEFHARGLVAGRTGPSEALTALNALIKPLTEHLAHEEGEGMAIASRVLSHREWKEFEQRAWIDGFTAAQSVRFLAWMADGVEWQEPVRRRAGLPAPLYWTVVKPLSLIARVPGPSVWAGTPAARIKSRMAPA
ncbi:hemerythrin domain-containing protein [Actinocorallia populi]|uniref:hemerythrin domain-containing protein n=1 Tax=Actinocorallia populi TaxID=2079200 RepID=UPI000D096DD0|nr:hemerythrin domain-containing protein [Actinocorallia populi]